jgi:hypothetical protein
MQQMIQQQQLRLMQQQAQAAALGIGGGIHPQQMANQQISNFANQLFGVTPIQQQLQPRLSGGNDHRSLLLQQHQKLDQQQQKQLQEPSIGIIGNGVASISPGMTSPGLITSSFLPLQNLYGMQPQSSPQHKGLQQILPPPGDVATTDTKTRVLPVSIFSISHSVATSSENQQGREKTNHVGGVSDAALLYTKYAIESIVNSLNKRLKENGENGTNSLTNGRIEGENAEIDDGNRVYTVRDLSTCLGAWNLNISAKVGNNINGPSISTPSDKRQKLNGIIAEAVGSGSPSITSSKKIACDGNADTAFKFYYERSCPILLDANRRSPCTTSSTLTLPFCVEDFVKNGGCVDLDDENLLPVVAGAVVLTYGADSNFTGGVGEEGVLTKMIVDFFFDVATVYRSESNEKASSDRKKNDDVQGDKRKLPELDEDATAEAEEQIFARSILNGEQESSSLIRAALCALSPPSTSNSTSSADDGLYIPTIWSGNTNRIYQYCLLGNFDDNLKERASKRLCVAIKKKNKGEYGGESGPARGVCRITLTLSPASVVGKKKFLEEEAAKKDEEENDIESSISTCSEVHRKIRHCLRILRPPALITVSTTRDGDTMMDAAKRGRSAIRRSSVKQLIDPASIVVGIRCKHELLLDGDEVGKVYVNGALAVDCSESMSTLNRMGVDALPAHTLFGVDFTIPFADGRYVIGLSGLPSKLVIEREYGALLVDALIDAGQCDAGVAKKLLGRLITGKVEQAKDSDEDDAQYHGTKHSYPIEFDNVSKSSLESIVLLSTAADPVGVGAKALGTKFRVLFGSEAFPCEVGTNEECLLHQLLGAQKIPKLVPRRARDVLLRGGYLRIDQMAKFLWVGRDGGTWDGDHSDAMRAAKALEGGIKLLRKAGCMDVMQNKIRLVSRKKVEPAMFEKGVGEVDTPFTASSKFKRSPSKLRCWYDSSSETFYVSDAIFFVEEDHDGENVEAANVSCADDQCIGTTTAKGLISDSTNSPHYLVNNTELSVEVDAKMSRIDAFYDKDDDSSVVVAEESIDTEDEAPKVAGGDNSSNTREEFTKRFREKAMDDVNTQTPKLVSAEDAAFLLAFYIAKVHPNVMVLERFVMGHRSL